MVILLLMQLLLLSQITIFLLQNLHQDGSYRIKYDDNAIEDESCPPPQLDDDYGSLQANIKASRNNDQRFEVYYHPIINIDEEPAAALVRGQRKMSTTAKTITSSSITPPQQQEDNNNSDVVDGSNNNFQEEAVSGNVIVMASLKGILKVRNVNYW